MSNKLAPKRSAPSVWCNKCRFVLIGRGAPANSEQVDKHFPLYLQQRAVSPFTGNDSNTTCVVGKRAVGGQQQPQNLRKKRPEGERARKGAVPQCGQTICQMSHLK